MPEFRAPLDHIHFVLYEVLNAPKLTELPGYEEATEDLVTAVLEEGARLCEQTLFPLNQSGDQEGCRFKDGAVTTPEGFREAYRTFAEGGWPGMAADPEYGGQGLPHLVNFVMQELISAANLSFGMYPGLSHGAYDAIHKHGSEEQKKLYLPKLIEGTWSGTMNLTEPHCGTDLGLIKTRAAPVEGEEGAYRITGTKIYISAGEHDLTENIVHLVLARLPDAPEGVKGISLFVVPKFLAEQKDDGDWGPGERNALECGGIEEKMGIHGSSTCVMNFDGAKGWLVGAPHKGLRAMFTMMNAARLGVGMQGLGIAEVAYQNAAQFAKERLQMRSLAGPQYPEKDADPIIVHPDVRRMLLTMKAFTEGARALSYWVGMNLDIAEHHPDADKRREAEDFVSLLTPVIKAYQTDMGFECANLAIQVYGGHGYVQDYGVEQYARDARITMIYEGTNGIQALDLVGRKMSQNTGRLLRRFFHPVADFIELKQDDPNLQEFILPLAKSFSKLQQATATLAQKGLKNPLEAGAGSTDYLRLFALTAMAYMWAQMAEKAIEKKAEGGDKGDFYATRIHIARFFMQRMLPEADACFKKLMAGGETVMAMDEAAF